MMEHSDMIQVETDENITVVSMNNVPENRQNGPFIEALSATLTALKGDESAKVVILTSSIAKFFSNGYDLEWMMQNIHNQDTVDSFMHANIRFLSELCVYPKPIIAAINGHAIGQGAFLAGCCDFRIMNSDRGWLQFPEVHINLAFVPSQIGIMKEILPPRAMRDMAFLGRRYSATQGVELQYIDKASPADQVLAEARTLAGELMGVNLSAYAEIKRRIRGNLSQIIVEKDPPVINAMLASFRG